MTIQNKLGDFLIRIQNAQNTNKVFCKIPYSKLIFGIINVLYKEGYINGFFINKQEIHVFLKYKRDDTPVIKRLIQKSKGGQPEYITVKKLRALEKNNLNIGVIVISSSKGVCSQKEALAKNIGGKVLCQII